MLYRVYNTTEYILYRVYIIYYMLLLYRPDVMLKKLRYYTRFIVVALLLRRMNIVSELVKVNFLSLNQSLSPLQFPLSLALVNLSLTCQSLSHLSISLTCQSLSLVTRSSGI